MKLTNILLAITLLLIVGGCSKKTDMKTTTCSIDLGLMSITSVLDYDANDNKVYKQTTTNKLSLSESEATKEELEVVLKETQASYDINGVTYEYAFSEDLVTETTTVDYTVTNFNELLEADLIEADENSKLMTYVDYQLTVDSLEAAGLTCN